MSGGASGTRWRDLRAARCHPWPIHENLLAARIQDDDRQKDLCWLTLIFVGWFFGATIATLLSVISCALLFGPSMAFLAAPVALFFITVANVLYIEPMNAPCGKPAEAT
jgi:hypothetical protein